MTPCAAHSALKALCPVFTVHTHGPNPRHPQNQPSQHLVLLAAGADGHGTWDPAGALGTYAAGLAQLGLLPHTWNQMFTVRAMVMFGCQELMGPYPRRFLRQYNLGSAGYRRHTVSINLHL